MDNYLIFENQQIDKKKREPPKPKMKDIFKIPHGMEKMINKKEQQVKNKKK